jgi:hypothetical protein
MKFLNILQPKVYTGAILALFTAVCIISCTSCRDDKPVPTPVVPTVIVPPLPAVQTVSAGKISVVIPVSFQDQHPDSVSESNYVLYADKTAGLLISLQSKTYPLSYDELVLEAIRANKDDDAAVQSANAITINGQDMTVVESLKENVVAWFFLTLKDGVSYNFSCGGAESETQLIHDFCFNAANSLKIQ